MTKPRLGMLLIVVTGVLWGTIGPAANMLFRETDLDAVSISWLRALIATPIFLVLAWRELGRSLFATSRRDLTIMVALGIALILYQYLYLAAVKELGVTAATLISLCTPPVLVAVSSSFLLHEPVSGRVAISLVGALIGTALLVGWNGANGSGSPWLGVLLAVGSAVGIAAHVMTSRSLAGRHPPLRPLAVSFLAGTVVFAPLALRRGISLRLGVDGWAWLLYLAIFTSVLGYLFYQRGLRDVTATTASIITLIEPLVSGVLAWWLFDERLGLTGLVGGLLLIGSIALLTFAPAARRQIASDSASEIYA